MAEEATPVPKALADGVPMLKISSKKIKQVIIRIQDGAIDWSSIKISRVPISSIRELRLNQPPTDGYPASRWITVVYTTNKTQWKVLHMTALTDDVYDLWTKTLTALVSETSDRLIAQVTPTDPDLMWIRQLWPAGAKVIDFNTAAGLCGGLGMIIPPGVAEKYTGQPLDLAAFRQLIREAQTRPELEGIYKEMTEDGPLDRAAVDKFLREVQCIDPARLFDQFKQGEIWTLESLTEFLLSPENTQNTPQDTSRPLPDYYISSSHNTYLVGEQWRGESTVEGYIRVLLAKCRCVEIDCFDGDSEPEVYHKKTLTSKVSVRDICQAINKYAFVASPYPVIISAETHCSLEQQDMMAKIMRDCFGDRLITDPIEGVSGMPSPEQLKGRILFKTKPPGEKKNKRKSFFESSSTPSDTSSTESDSGFARLARRISIGSGGGSANGSSARDVEKRSFAQSLADLLIYTAGVKYQGFSKLIEYEPHQQFSLSENTGLKVIKENVSDWIKHNFTHLSRVYPKGFRLGSSNYDPVPFWRAGTQLVALNWQTIDEGTTLNHALFGDTLGYVLKPPSLREKTTEPLKRYRVGIHILSAQRLPISSDLYVEATLTCGGADTPPNKRTSTLKGTAFNPIWDERVHFECVSTASMLFLTFLKVEIKSAKSAGGGGGSKGLIAQWARGVGRVPRGYHHLPLYDPLFSRFVFATLFVRIDVDEVG